MIDLFRSYNIDCALHSDFAPCVTHALALVRCLNDFLDQKISEASFFNVVLSYNYGFLSSVFIDRHIRTIGDPYPFLSYFRSYKDHFNFKVFKITRYGVVIFPAN